MVQDTLKGKVIGVNVKEEALSIIGIKTDTSKFTAHGVKVKEGAKIKIKSLSKNVLFILDGKKVDDIHSVDPNNIEAITVLKDKASIDLYGTEGKDGVVLVTTKSGDATFSVKDSVGAHDKYNKIESTNSRVLTNVITGKPNLLPPLYVLDGKIYEGNINKINQSMIASIEVLKGPSAHALYGSKGENGVIIVTTKTSAEKNPDTLKTDIKKIINREISKERVRQDSVKTLKGSQVNQIKVTGYKKSADDFYATTLQQEKLKKFLNDNKGNINPKDGYVLVINGKVARESDLKEVDAKTVTKVMATDLTSKNSPLSKNIIGLLALESSANKKAVLGASASVVKNGKEIKLLVNEGDQNPRIVIK